jgi:hypothetical protein
MTLYDRCKDFLSQQQMRAMMRTGSPVDELVSFVETERGRAADKALEGTAPLVLYFGSQEDRDEMIAAIQEAKPGMSMRKMP